MEFVILGLLMIRERTLYEMKKVLEDTISLFYSASFGSISSALGKLLEKQWIVVQAQVEHGRNKKMYAITPAGATAFHAWLGSHIPSEKVKDPALTRLFFMGYLAPQQRIEVIENHVASLEAMYASLDLLEKQAAALAVPDKQQELAAFQRLTLHYGRDYYAFSIAWFKRLLTSLKEQEHDADS